MLVVCRPRRLLVSSLLTTLLVGVLASPGVASADEPTTVSAGDTVVGELVQGYADPGPVEHRDTEPADDGAGLLSWVETEDGEAVRVPTEDMAAVPVGATVQVTVGRTVQDEASDDGLEAAHDVLSAEVVTPADPPPTSPATAPVNHQVTVVMMEPTGTAAAHAADPTTMAQLVAAVNGPVADFWSEQTGGAARFGVVAGFDWAPTTAGCSAPFDLWQAAATRAGWTSGAGKHLLVYVPYNSPGCSYGLGTIGSGLASGGMAYVQGTATSVVAHEFGHNLGLGHSSSVQCDRSVDSGTCQTVSYGDYYDVMGVSWDQVGSLNVPQAARLGVLPPAQQVGMTVTSAAATQTLVPISAGSGVRALQLTDLEGATYWLEYRAANGRDSWLGQPSANWLQLQAGVTLRRAADQPDTALLLDGSPSAATGWAGDRQVALPVGSPVRVSDGDFVVTVTGVTATQATVQVTPSSGPRPVAQPTGDPRAAVDEVTRRGAGVLVRGWAYDPDAPDAVVPIAVSIDGAAATVSSAADVSESAFADAAALQAFSRTIPVPAGPHQVCASALNVAGPGQALLLGCRSV